MLSLQGAFDKHLAMFASLGIDARPFKELDQLGSLRGLVIPGGESTTIGMLMDRRGLTEAIKQALLAGLPAFGTCAGAILLAKEIENSDQTKLDVMDIVIVRNAYGRQIDSFEAIADISLPPHQVTSVLNCVFIRAPIIRSCSVDTVICSQFNGQTILALQKNMLVATFHPELGDNPLIHSYFAKTMCAY